MYLVPLTCVITFISLNGNMILMLLLVCVLLKIPFEFAKKEELCTHH